ncbi:MAG TPA: glutaminase A [Gemmatimonadaceae bacterium]
MSTSTHARLRALQLAIAVASTVASLSIGAPRAQAQMPASIQSAVNAAFEKYRSLREGKNADYIPALAKVDPDLYGIVVVTPDGKMYSAGDITTQVSIQSISKVFTLARVLEDSGEKAVLDRIGVDATGRPFNSAYPVEEHQGKDINSFVNAGAIATTGMVGGSTSDGVWSRIIGTYSDFAGRPLTVQDNIYKSEAENNQHNRGLAELMHSWGTLSGNPDQALDLYTRQCSVGVNARDLAIMAGTLANDGKNPITGRQVLDARHVAPLLAVMATAGLYETTGQWLYATGLPAKSGVGGGLIAVSPGKFGIAVVSPPLDSAGNSVRAQKAITDIAAALNGNPYNAAARR